VLPGAFNSVAVHSFLREAWGTRRATPAWLGGSSDTRGILAGKRAATRPVFDQTPTGPWRGYAPKDRGAQKPHLTPP